jgi:hypothetical protein
VGRGAPAREWQAGPDYRSQGVRHYRHDAGDRHRRQAMLQVETTTVDGHRLSSRVSYGQ